MAENMKKLTKTSTKKTLNENLQELTDKLPEIINEDNLKDKIYTIRGQRVMLDYDLAKIYGYTTKAFNQQVARNIERFEGEDFMF